MTELSSDRNGRPEEEPGDDHGVLDEAGIDTTALGLLGTQTAQVRVVLPQRLEDPDADVVDDDLPGGDVRSGGIVIELPADEPDDDLDVISGELDESAVAAARDAAEPAVEDDVPVDEDAEPAVDEDEPVDADAESVGEDEPVDEDAESVGEDEPVDEDVEPAEEQAETVVDDEIVDVDDEPGVEDEAPTAEDAELVVKADAPLPEDDGPVGEDVEDAPEDGSDDIGEEDHETDAPAADDEAEVTVDAGADADDRDRAPGLAEPADEADTGDAALPTGYESFLRSVAATRDDDEVAADAADLDRQEDTDMPAADDERPPLTRPSFIEQAVPAAPAVRPAEVASRRAGEVSESARRESADVLTADRLLDTGAVRRPAPDGPWRQLVYRATGRLVNLGDSRRTRERKELLTRIAAPLDGAARFVPVLSRKGGVGKTTVTALLGMALADARDDRVIAVDANPDRGTLAERIARSATRTVRDLVRNRASVQGYADMSAHVVRDETRLDVLASDPDPRLSEAFGDDDYRAVADVAAHYYSIVLTDTGTGIVHSVMGATLGLADQLVVVAGLSVDEARLASETLTWLESNGYADRVREAVVVLNQSTPGAPLVRLDELEAHFRTRVRAVVRLPYDPRLATGSSIAFGELQESTRDAARELAARVVEGLRTRAAV
ncbi:nucleotide-binding protein [Microbacterium sp. NPDC055683]